jgi:hypothetical protein
MRVELAAKFGTYYNNKPMNHKGTDAKSCIEPFAKGRNRGAYIARRMTKLLRHGISKE